MQKLLARRSKVRFSTQATLHRADEGRRHGHAPHTAAGKVNGVIPVNDSLTPGHRVGDVREGREPVNHLVEDAAEGPHVAGLTEFHKLGLAGNPDAAHGVVVHQRLGRHVIWRADLRFSVDVDRLICLDSVGDAKVDEL